MIDAWRSQLLAAAESITRAWPAEARGEFIASVLAAPDDARPIGDDAVERIAGARALARAWFEVWRRTGAIALPVQPARPPLRPPPELAPPDPIAPRDDAEADELAALWRVLGRDLALAAMRK